MDDSVVINIFNEGCDLGNAAQYHKSIACFRACIRMRPEWGSAHVLLAEALLKTGNLEEGFAEYEWRLPTLHPYCEKFDVKNRWNGDSLQGKTILVYSEQGIGDAIFVSRWFPFLKNMGAKIILYCPDWVAPLMRHFDVDHVLNMSEPVNSYDCHCASFSLPHLLKEYQPQSSLDLPIQKDKSDKLRVGLVWAGSNQSGRDPIRSIPLRHFACLKEVDGIELYNLQTNERPDLAAEGLDMIDWSNVQSMEDYAFSIGKLDLLISCETAAMVVAGTMGVPCWALTPWNYDWRVSIDGTTSVWYNSVTMFRNFDCWDEVLQRVKLSLEEENAKKRSVANFRTENR